MQQADELAKLESGCEAVVGKVGDSLKVILDGDEGKIAQQKTVNDSQFMTKDAIHGLIWIESVDQYLKTFHWNKGKYRVDNPIRELIDTLQKVWVDVEMGQWSKDAALQMITRMTTGNLKYRQRC